MFDTVSAHILKIYGNKLILIYSRLNQLFLINSNITDLPLRRIPVMTLMSSEPIKGRIRCIYNSRLIIDNSLLSSHLTTTITHLYLINNNKKPILSVIADKIGKYSIYLSYNLTLAQLPYTRFLKPSLSFTLGKLSTAL